MRSTGRRDSTMAFAFGLALNSIIDYVKQNKLRRQTDEERKKNIVDVLEAMKINWRPTVVDAPVIKPRKHKAVA